MSQWTVDTLREYADRRLNDQRDHFTSRLIDADKAIQAALVSAEKAVTKAEIAAEKRFEGVNEFRKSLANQTATFVPRAEYVAANGSLAERINAMGDRMSALELRLTSRLDRGEGAEAGTGSFRNGQRLDIANILQALAVIGAIIGVLLVAFHH